MDPAATDSQGTAPIQQHIEEISSSAQRIVDETRGIATDISAVLDIPGRMARHPYGMLLAAAGVGYVLGGGLFSSFTFSLLRMGARVALVPLVKGQILPLAEAALTGSLSNNPPR